MILALELAMRLWHQTRDDRATATHGAAVDIMRDLVGRKFAGENLAVRLEETGAAPLVAGNHWHDGYWGVCRCPACAGVGVNVLGVVLMWVREAARWDCPCAGSPKRSCFRPEGCPMRHADATRHAAITGLRHVCGADASDRHRAAKRWLQSLDARSTQGGVSSTSRAAELTPESAARTSATQRR
jgi:hypothetical protein